MSEQKPSGLLRQWQAILAAVLDPALPRGGVAVLMCMADYTDKTTGLCWPALTTLARVTGLSRRYVADLVPKLVQLEYVTIPQRGTRTRSNRYKLTFKGAETVMARKHATAINDIGSDGQIATRGDAQLPTGSEPEIPTVVIHSSTCSDLQTHDVVIPRSLDPTHQPDHKGEADDVGLGPSSPTASAGIPAPGGASPASAKSGAENKWFWDCYPKKVYVAEADALLTELLAQGADKAAIEAGAIAYSKLVRAKGLAANDRYVQEPKNWLAKSRWLDDFTVVPPRDDAKPKPASTKSPARPSERAQAKEKAPAKAKAAPAKNIAPKPAKTPLSDAEKEMRKAERAAKAAAREAENQEYRAKRRLEESAKLENARERYASICKMLEPLPGMPADYSGKIFGACYNRKIIHCPSESARSAIRSVFVSAFNDRDQSSEVFVNVFGDEKLGLDSVVRDYVAAQLSQLTPP